MTTEPYIEPASPWEVISNLGGVASLKEVAKTAKAEEFCRHVGDALYEAYWDGYERRWTSQREMATVLDTSESIIKRLMAARDRPAYIRGTPYGEIRRIAEQLRIPLEGPRDRRDVESDVLRVVVSRMRAVRYPGVSGAPSSGITGEQLECVADLVEKCDGMQLSLWDGEGDFATWLGSVGKVIPEDPPNEASSLTADPETTAIAVGAADWLVARQYLSVFVEKLYAVCRMIDEDRKRYWAVANDAKELGTGLLEINKLLSAFRKTKHRTLGEVANILRFKRVSTVQALLERVDLQKEDFRDPDAELGRLIMISKKYRPKAQALLAFDSRYGSGPNNTERKPK